MYEANRGRRLLRRPSIFIAAALIAATGISMVPATTAAAGPDPASLCGAYATAQFGPNVCVFTPPSGANAATELQAIQTVLNNIATQQVPVTAQFNDEGYALLFEPGTYGDTTPVPGQPPLPPLVFQVGY